MSTEESMLLRSHSVERTKELISTRYSVTGEQRPYLILTKPPKQSIAPPKARKSGLRSNARNSLKQYIDSARKGQKLPDTNVECYLKNGAPQGAPKYQDFLPLHRLWQSYMIDLLFGSQNSDHQLTKNQMLACAAKLATADYHGAKLDVVSSRNPSLVGIQGIVIWEARSSFLIVVEEDVSKKTKGGLKFVEKKESLFHFTVSHGNETYDFEIIGSRFLYRTADRSGRKFKTRSVDDL
jgi:ribonuclease P protein subunit POP4